MSSRAASMLEDGYLGRKPWAEGGASDVVAGDSTSFFLQCNVKTQFLSEWAQVRGRTVSVAFGRACNAAAARRGGAGTKAAARAARNKASRGGKRR